MTNQHSKLLDAAKVASSNWQAGFNNGNAQQCAEQYEQEAVMDARPFGRFEGRQDIQSFWQQLIDDGFNDVQYIEPIFEVVNDTSVLLTSKWKMNKAQGVIHKELWCLQADGTAKLKEDDFEAL
jgi:ketosteroid isomerase-like protein